MSAIHIGSIGVRRPHWAPGGRILGACVLACVAGGLVPQPLRAQEVCSPESECRFKKPNVLVVLDYSSSMVGSENDPAYFPPGQNVSTRWDAQLDAVSWILRYDQGFFARNARIGLSRFAHDPDVGTPGTVLVTDRSFPPITDGFAVDVPFDGSDGEYLECRSSGVEAEVEVLRGTPPPWISGLDPFAIMLTWTRGALRSGHELIRRTRASHASEPDEACSATSFSDGCIVASPNATTCTRAPSARSSAAATAGSSLQAWPIVSGQVQSPSVISTTS
jgi:hypothetical protein